MTMDGERTLYDELEVIPEACIEVILAAHRALVNKHHPDRAANGAEATKRTQRLNHARDILKDAQKRAEYDLTLLGVGRGGNGRHQDDNGGRTHRPSGPTCPRCGKGFKTSGGLEWHRTNNPNCA